jgi:hypothetical protein
MKQIYLLILLISTAVYSQKKEIKSFEFKGKNIEYSIIDYSKLSVAHYFITMYNDTNENVLVEKNAINCLSKYDNLYHTFFFFLKIPVDITDDSEITEFYLEFIAHLSKEQDIEKYNLFLNFDSDYNVYHLMNYNIKRIISNINSNNICDYLTIR